jgi:hypothetical protein
MEMFRRDGRTEELIGAYRNALVAGASQEELARLADALDPDLVQMVHQMRGLGRRDRPSPEPAFANRLERELLAAFGQAHGTSVPLRASPPRALNGHVTHEAPVRSGPVVLSDRRPTWNAASLAAAALILLTLAGGLIAVRAITQPRPAAVLEAANSPAVETLVDGVIESASESWTPMTVEQWTFQPGNAALTIPALDGPQWIVPELAPLVAVIDGQEQVVPPETGLVIPAGHALVLSNPGTGELTLYRGVASAGFSLEEFDRAAIAKQTALDTESHEALPPGESHIVFERLILQPGTTLLTEPATGQDWVDIISGQLGLTLIGDSLPDNWESGREREVATSDLLPALVPGTRVSFRNIGDEPLILLRLRVSPLSASTEPGAS